jgi:hypothetical protein
MTTSPERVENRMNRIIELLSHATKLADLQNEVIQMSMDRMSEEGQEELPRELAETVLYTGLAYAAFKVNIEALVVEARADIQAKIDDGTLPPDALTNPGAAFDEWRANQAGTDDSREMPGQYL